MPNWVDTTLTVRGDVKTLREFYNAAQTPEDRLGDGREGQILDFNAFVPMPPELEISCGSSTDDGEILYAKHTVEGLSAYSQQILKELGIDLSSSRAVDAAKLVFDILVPAMRVHGLTAARNRERFGHTDWYSWSIENWGSKWNAHNPQLLDYDLPEIELPSTGDTKLAPPAEAPSTSKGRLQYSFLTAWSPVEPVLVAMSAAYPDLTFEAVFEEESRLFYYSAIFEKGEKINEEDLTYLWEDEDEEEWRDEDAQE
jgi:hypothetical protein